MADFLPKLHHDVPYWVDPNSLFHIRIRLDRDKQQTPLTDALLATTLLESAEFYDSKFRWHIESVAWLKHREGGSAAPRAMSKEVCAAVSAAIFSIEVRAGLARLLDPPPRLRERADRSVGDAKNKCGFRRVLHNVDQKAARLAILRPLPVANTRDIRLWAIDRL